MELADFEPLKPAEAKLVDWLKAGNRGTCVISGKVPPEVPNRAHVIRATLIRWLALGGGEGCKPPETGVRVQGAFIEGNDTRGAKAKGIDVEGATLAGDVLLVDCRIPDLIVLRSASIRSLILDRSSLMAGIGADGMEAKRGVFLRGAKVTGEVRLLGARIGGNLECTGTTFKAEKPGKALSCDGIEVKGNIALDRADVTGEARLLGASVSGDVSCNSAKLTAGESGVALSCDRAVVSGALFFQKGAKVKGYLDLVAASFGTINDDPACWPTEILLDRCRYGAFTSGPTDAATRKRWLALQKPEDYGVDFWPDPYEHCAKVLREAGHVADAREILIEKEKLQRAARRKRLARELEQARKKRDAAPPTSGFRPHNDRVIGLWWHVWALSVWDAILGAVVGYGRKPQNAALWALVFIGVGWVFFLRAEGFGHIKPNLPQVQRAPEWVECRDGGERRAGFETQVACFYAQPEGRAYPRFNALVYSIDTFTPVVSLEMQSYWIPDDTKPIGSFARFYLWLHIAMGWGLTLLAVAGFSGLIKQDSK